MKKHCKRCGEFKKQYTKGLCKICYNKEHPGPMRRCIKCGEIKSHCAKGMCRNCYQKQIQGGRYKNDPEYRKKHDEQSKRWVKEHPKRVRELQKEANERAKLTGAAQVKSRRAGNKLAIKCLEVKIEVARKTLDETIEDYNSLLARKGDSNMLRARKRNIEMLKNRVFMFTEKKACLEKQNEVLEGRG